MKTPMQELIEHIGKTGIKQYPISTLELIEELIEKEKQVIIDAWFHGNTVSIFEGEPPYGEEYYNETFKN